MKYPSYSDQKNNSSSSDPHGGILSDIFSGILSGFWHSVWRYGVRVQACPTASGAGDMVSGAHSTVQEEDGSDGSEWKKQRGRKQGREGGRKEGIKESRRSCTFAKICRDPHLAGGEKLISKPSIQSPSDSNQVVQVGLLRVLRFRWIIQDLVRSL